MVKPECAFCPLLPWTNFPGSKSFAAISTSPPRFSPWVRGACRLLVDLGTCNVGMEPDAHGSGGYHTAGQTIARPLRIRIYSPQIRSDRAGECPALLTPARTADKIGVFIGPGNGADWFAGVVVHKQVLRLVVSHQTAISLYKFIPNEGRSLSRG